VNEKCSTFVHRQLGQFAKIPLLGDTNIFAETITFHLTEAIQGSGAASITDGPKGS
jgi:hypothetical protein